MGFLDDVKLETARRGAAGAPATWIEMCTCPSGYVGQFCESCAPGFRHDPASGGPFAPCVPCNCHGHADICDADTGMSYMSFFLPPPFPPFFFLILTLLNVKYY